MNSKRSYLETLNAGRQRRAHSSIEQLNKSLEIELTKTRTDLEDRVRQAATIAAATDAAKDD